MSLIECFPNYVRVRRRKTIPSLKLVNLPLNLVEWGTRSLRYRSRGHTSEEEGEVDKDVVVAVVVAVDEEEVGVDSLEDD